MTRRTEIDDIHFYNNRHRPHRDWKTQSKKRNICMVFCTLFCLMSFFHNITKGKKYITIIIKRRVGVRNSGILRLAKQTITTQHKYLLTAKKKRYKNEKESKRIWQRKVKEIGTYEVKYSKQLRGRESEAFSTIY